MRKKSTRTRLARTPTCIRITAIFFCMRVLFLCVCVFVFIHDGIDVSCKLAFKQLKSKITSKVHTCIKEVKKKEGQKIKQPTWLVFMLWWKTNDTLLCSPFRLHFGVSHFFSSLLRFAHALCLMLLCANKIHACDLVWMLFRRFSSVVIVNVCWKGIWVTWEEKNKKKREKSASSSTTWWHTWYAKWISAHLNVCVALLPLYDWTEHSIVNSMAAQSCYSVAQSHKTFPSFDATQKCACKTQSLHKWLKIQYQSYAIMKPQYTLLHNSPQKFINYIVKKSMVMRWFGPVQAKRKSIRFTNQASQLNHHHHCESSRNDSIKSFIAHLNFFSHIFKIKTYKIHRLNWFDQRI